MLTHPHPDAGTSARLAEVARLAADRDRSMARLVGLLVSISKAGDLASLTDGMSLHVWMQHTARCTHAEARELLGAAEVLAHMPATLAGLGDSWLSWSQVAALVRAARRVPVARRVELDALVGDALARPQDDSPLGRPPGPRRHHHLAAPTPRLDDPAGPAPP